MDTEKFVQLHKNTKGEFYVLINGKGRVTHESSQYYSNRSGALNPTYALAARFGGSWNGYYWDHTKDQVYPTMRFHPFPKPRKTKKALPVKK